MFKTIRIVILLVILAVVWASTRLTEARSTDWNNSLWVKVYPINGDGSAESQRYIETLNPALFAPIEEFISTESVKYGRNVHRPLRMELGVPVNDQPPELAPSPMIFDVMLWSLRMRWWAGSVSSAQDSVAPDVRIFVRYHAPQNERKLENSVGMQKGMVGIVNAFAGKQHAAVNNVIIAHEFLHTLGASDKYQPGDGLPVFPSGYAEPARRPLLPQRLAEIMGGRIALSESDAVIPKSLKYAVIGPETAREIRLKD